MGGAFDVFLEIEFSYKVDYSFLSVRYDFKNTVPAQPATLISLVPV